MNCYELIFIIFLDVALMRVHFRNRKSQLIKEQWDLEDRFFYSSLSWLLRRFIPQQQQCLQPAMRYTSIIQKLETNEMKSRDLIS